MADPKAQARLAQQASDRAKAAAKDAAEAAARAEAKAESQAGSSNAEIAGSTAARATTGIAANVALDVFTQVPSARTVERSAESGTSDLSNEQQRMADSRGRGIAGATSGRKIGETDDPDTSSWQRPGATDRPAGPGDFADSPFGDRHDVLRNGPESESENPLDSFGKIPDRGADLLAATGQGGGLNAAAASLHTLPQSGQGQVMGKDMISDEPSTSPLGKLVDEAAYKLERIAADGFFAHNDEAERQQLDSDWKEQEDTESLFDGFKFINEAIQKADQQEINRAKIPPGMRPANSQDATQPVPDDFTPLPPGWIDGDAILPPGLRTGAAVGGAKGNDGIDWANQRWGTSNPDPNAGGGGRPSAGDLWRQKQTNESLVGQPDADDAGGASVPTWAERQNRVSNPTGTDHNPAYGKGPAWSEAVNTDPNQNDVSHLWGSGDENDDVVKAAVRLMTVRFDDTDTDTDD